MSNLIIEKLLAKTKRTDIPEFRPGDTVRVHVKIKEGDKERVQAFEGVVIKRDNGPQASFTVRKISFGQGVERIFPIHSKVVDKVELMRSSKVRRARLFYAERGGIVEYHDDYVPTLPELGLQSVPVENVLAEADAVVLVTAHPGLDYFAIAEQAALFIDLRGVTRGKRAQNLVRL